MAVRARNILVGYDGTESGRRALAAAADLTGYASMLTVAAMRPETTLTRRQHCYAMRGNS